MPSSGRSERSPDRSKKAKRPASGRTAAGEDAAARAQATKPADELDPIAPWDAPSAEALTHLYESGEACLDGQQERARPRRWQPPHGEPSASAAPSPAPPAADNAWLEAHLADMARRLQESLAELDPDKSLGSLNRRLDQIEQRLGEALADVAQRSDLGALRLIEANVLELAQHMEQARGRLDRLDAIDDQVRDLARRIEEGDQPRLAALETLLRDCVAELRRGDERTASALGTLEEAVNRVGEQVEAVEAHKPVPNLSLYALATPEPAGASAGRDPLSQAYTDAALALERQSLRSSLDAADYAPRAAPAMADRPQPPPLQPPALTAEPPPPEPHPAAPAEPLPSPASRASAMRAKLRLAQLCAAQEERAPVGAAPRGARKVVAQSLSWWRSRAGLLLSVALVVCAAGGYLMVDALMTTPMPGAAGIERAGRPADPGAATTGGPADLLDTRASGDDPVRTDALGAALRAAFRARTPSGQPAPEPAAVPPSETPAIDAPAGAAMTSLPMTIGPASLRQAAMRGEAAAQLEIAARFATGLGVPRDLQQAVRWYGLAAAQGMALAQYRLGMFHERGWGTPVDPERARVWYQRAAEQGNVRAMHNLAVLSVSGGRSDYTTAAKWFTRAADSGLADSQFNLAVLHQTGLGMPKDLRLAYKWLTLAARGGDREATAGLAAVRARLAPGDLQEADALVSAWRPRTPDPAVNEPAGLSVAR